MTEALAVAATTHSRRGISKGAMAYDHLRAAIIGLELKPGARIDKLELCERLQVSRQPLAEAIARLADERLVVVEPQKGTFVARISLADVTEAAFLRRALEVATVEAIAPGIDQVTLKRLERLLSYQAAALKADDTDEFYTLDVRFHVMLFDRLAMRRVAEAVEASRAPLERIRRILLPTPGRRQNTLREHRAIFAALAARDPQKAGAAMRAHLDQVMEDLKKFAARQPELFEP